MLILAQNHTSASWVKFRSPCHGSVASAGGLIVPLTALASFSPPRRLPANAPWFATRSAPAAPRSCLACCQNAPRDVSRQGASGHQQWYQQQKPLLHRLFFIRSARFLLKASGTTITIQLATVEQFSSLCEGRTGIAGDGRGESIRRRPTLVWATPSSLHHPSFVSCPHRAYASDGPKTPQARRLAFRTRKRESTDGGPHG